MSERTIRLTLIGAITIGIVALAALALWTLDFHLSQSQTQAQHRLSTSSVTYPDQKILVEDGIVIRTVETGIELLDRTLAEEVTRQFQSTLPNGTVMQGDESNGEPILWIEITESDIRWMPFRSTAELEVEVFYASDGDLSWRNATGTVMQGEQPAVHSRGTLTVNDHTQGLISRKAYQRHLGVEIAAEIYRTMQQPLFDPPG